MENSYSILQNIERLWTKFNEAKARALRKMTNTILSEIIVSIDALDYNVRNHYLVTLMEKYFEEDIQYPIQDPRLWKHCLDILRIKFEQKESKYLIWIYKAYSYNGVYDIVKMSPREFLELSLDNDLHNNEIASLLYKEYLNTIDFATHELPDYLVIEEDLLVDLIRRSLNMEYNYPHTKGLKNMYGNNLEFYIKIFDEWKTSKNRTHRITERYPFSK